MKNQYNNQGEVEKIGENRKKSEMSVLLISSGKISKISGKSEKSEKIGANQKKSEKIRTNQKKSGNP